jgi:hypothetical protein
MKQWWQMTDEELAADKNARRAKRIAYYNTFFGTDDGRDVLNDIRETCFNSQNIELICLYLNIRNNAGRTRETEKAMIDAEAQAIGIGE